MYRRGRETRRYRDPRMTIGTDPPCADGGEAVDELIRAAVEHAVCRRSIRVEHARWRACRSAGESLAKSARADPAIWRNQAALSRPRATRDRRRLPAVTRNRWSPAAPRGIEIR